MTRGTPSLLAAETGGASTRAARALSWWPRDATRPISLGRTFSFAPPSVAASAPAGVARLAAAARRPRDEPRSPMMLLFLGDAADGVEVLSGLPWGLSAPVAPPPTSGAPAPLELSSVLPTRSTSLHSP